MKKNNLIIAAGTIGILVLASIYFISQKPAEIPDGNQNDELNWVTYENAEFGFRLRHPADWKVAEDPENNIQPAFNFYPPEVQDPRLPLIHHSFEPNVSVFPYGVPTEGIFGSSQPSTLTFSEKPANAIDFLLENGEVWGTYANYPDGPKESWQESGFIWARAGIENYSQVCLRNGKEISPESCDLLGGGDELVHKGQVDAEMRRVQEEILKSFEFID